MEIILFRHFETAYSREHRICGRLDCPILPDPRIVVPPAVRAAVAGRRVVYYSSPLTRCRESYRLLDGRLRPYIAGSSAVILPQLIERAWGPLSGLTKEEVLAAYHGDVESVKRAAPGVETDERLQERVAEALELILRERDGVPVVVSHQGCIRAAARHFGLPSGKIEPGGFLIVNT